MLFTKLSDTAVFAVWFSGVTAVSAVENQGVMGSRPSVLRNCLHQRQLRLQNILFADKTDSVCYSEYVSIHRNALMSKAYGKYYVSSLSAYPRQFHQLVIVFRHFAVIFICQHFRHLHDIL